MDDYEDEEGDQIEDLNTKSDGVGAIKDIGSNQIGFTMSDDKKSMPPPMGKPLSGMKPSQQT
jgi:hypothetical protein